MTDTPEVVVLGAGAMGTLVAGSLARAKQKVLLIGRGSSHVRAIQSGNLRIVEIDGRPRKATVQTYSLPGWPVGARYLIVLVKSWATFRAVDAFSEGVLDPDVLVVTLQNGLGNLEAIHKALPDHPRSSITAGVTTEGALFEKPGQIRHTGLGITRIGVPPGGDRAAVERLCVMLTTAGLQAEVAEDIQQAIWSKLAVNAAINGVTALAEVRNGEIVDDPALRAVAERAAREVAAVARTEGVEIGDPVAAMLEVATATAQNRSSMLRDLELRRRTEVDAIHGEVARRGAAAGIDVPINQAMAAMIDARGW